MVVNLILSAYIFGEAITWGDIICTIFICAGCGTCALFGAQSASVNGLEDVLLYFSSPGTPFYFGCLALLLTCLLITVHVLEAPYRIARRKTMPGAWEVSEVREWLQIIECRDVEPAIIESDINGMRLLCLDSAGLLKIGITNEERRELLLSEIETLNLLANGTLEWDPLPDINLPDFDAIVWDRYA